MPNWTKCILAFKGKKHDLYNMFSSVGSKIGEMNPYSLLCLDKPKESLSTAELIEYGNDPLEACKIIPYPKEWFNELYQSRYSFNHSSSQNKPHHYTQIGCDWEAHNWGHKWGFCHWNKTHSTVLEELSPSTNKPNNMRSYRLQCEVPWSNPSILLQTLVNQYPLITIDATFIYEDQQDIKHKHTYEANQ